MRFAARWLLAIALSIASASAHAWDGYQIIEWQARDAAQLATLKRLGVTAGTVIANRDGSGTPIARQIAPLLANGMRWYVENIATDFYAPYHRWFPDHAVNWRFVEAQQRYRANSTDRAALWRDPSLLASEWQQKIRARLAATVREQARYRALYYSLGDETGIADLSAFWDFDLSPASLAGMRDWLRHEYGSLAALNAEWDTHFVRWSEVRPETTREAMRRGDDNFAAWADFKAWMDVAFARALRVGTDAVHAADPRAFAAIEGVQIPGWGGYDYSLLTQAVDVMEVYDLPLARSLNPRLIMLSTSFGSTPRDLHAIWRGVLQGSRGLILWDDDNSIVRPDATLGERGRGYADIFAELRGPLGALLTDCQPQVAPVAILYSPASFRTQWMLDHRPQGDAWMTRSAEDELGSNAVRDAMRAYAQALAHIGVQPQFLSDQMLANGALERRGIRLLILPHVIALSEAAAHAMQRFAQSGGSVIADTQPGLFDSHSRRLPQPLSTAAQVVPEAKGEYLSRAGVSPPLHVDAPNDDVEIHVCRHHGRTAVALQRDFSPQITNGVVQLTLPHPAEIVDLRQRRSLGRTASVVLTLDPVTPTILSIAP